MSQDQRAQQRLVDRVSRVLELQERGQPVDLRAVCEGDVELERAVADVLPWVPELPALHGAARAHDPLLGAELAGRYRIQARIGGGAMGVVYRGVDRELARSVAVKVLRQDRLAGPQAERRFEREAEVLARLDHAAVVTVFDRGVTGDGLAYLVMEDVAGPDLTAVLEALPAAPDRGELERLRARLGPEAHLASSWLRQAVTWVAALADGAHAAHEAGVFHRDIKPSNALVRGDGRAVLVDFGLAALAAQPTLASQTGLVGTPAYSAPEQLARPQGPSVQQDVYGLCATLYHLITRRPPYAGTPSQIIAASLRREPRPPQRLQAGLPRDLLAVLERGMARDPRRRYPTARALADDLRRFLAHEPVAARRQPAPVRLWRRATARREVRAVLGLLLLLCVALAALQGWHLRQQWRADRWLQAYRPLPATATLARNPADNRITDRDEREALARLLDQQVRYAAHPLPSRALRAAFRLDHGDRAGAAEDVTAIAAALGTPYAQGLAQRYAGHPPDAAPAALDLAGLPEPASVDDRFLAAYHELRRGPGRETVARGLELLDHPEVVGHRAARELRFGLAVAAASGLRGRAERVQDFRMLHDEVVRFEGELGVRTANTAMLLGTALIGQERYEEAAIALRDGLALAPRSVVLLINLGLALRRSGAAQQAAGVLERATQLRPRSLTAWRQRVEAEIDAGQFELASESIAAAPLPHEPQWPVRQLGLRARLEVCRALGHRGIDEAATVAAAQRALGYLTELSEAGGRVSAGQYGLAKALAQGDPDEVMAQVFAGLAREPANWRQIDIAAELLPEELGVESTAQLRRFLHALTRRLAPVEERAPAPASSEPWTTR